MLADFVTSITNNTKVFMIEEKDGEDKCVVQSDKEESILHTDGSLSLNGAGSCLILNNPTGKDVTYTL